MVSISGGDRFLFVADKHEVEAAVSKEPTLQISYFILKLNSCSFHIVDFQNCFQLNYTSCLFGFISGFPFSIMKFMEALCLPFFFV